MKKRRASSDLQPAKAKNTLDDRRVELAQTLRALNSQFCEWVQEQNRDKPAELWSEGVEDYLTHANELLSEFSDVIDEEEEGKQEEAEEAAGAAAPNSSANGFGSAFKLAPSLQPSGGFSTAGSGSGTAFGAAASQPAGGSAPTGASQPQHQQSSSVADFLKGIPTPSSQSLTGFGSGKLPPIPAFNFSNAGKSTAAGGSGGLDGGLGSGGVAAVPVPGSSKPPLFNFSTAFGGSSSALPATGPSSTSSPPAASPSASKPFGFGGAQPNTNDGAGSGSAASSGSASSSVFGSKAPPFGSGGFAYGAAASAAPSAAASSSAAAPSLLPATSNGAASSGTPAASGSLFATAPNQPLPSLFSFPGGKAGAASGAAVSAPVQNGTKENENGDAPDENPEDMVKVQLDETASDILYRDNAKLYFQDKVTKKWEDRGRGNLTLRRAKQQPGASGPNTPFLVFTMESGRVLLNASLYKGLSMQQQKAMVLMTLEVAESGDDGAAKSAMTLVNFRLRSQEDGKNFHDKIKEHVPS